MKIGKRKLKAFTRRISDINSYKSISRFFTIYDHPVRAVFDEIFSSGHYPRTLNIKTPIGKCEVRLFSLADFSTLNLVFCRQDYYTPQTLQVVVDIGSNIGLSSLYWLTRNHGSFVYCYEPSPISFERLRENLQAFEKRYVPHQVAVSDFCGQANLGIEEYGVYSSLDFSRDTNNKNFINHVQCRVVHINDLLEDVLAKHEKIDVLKIDSEGHELRTIQAIDTHFWPYIYCVNIDGRGASAYIPQEFHYSPLASAERFYRL